MGVVHPFPAGYAERLEAAGAHERDTRQAHALALEARNRLIHEAVDNGVPGKFIAKVLRMSPPSVTRILSVPPGDPHAA